MPTAMRKAAWVGNFVALIPDDGPGQAGGPGDDRLPGQLGVTPGGQVQQQDAAGGPLDQGADR